MTTLGGPLGARNRASRVAVLGALLSMLLAPSAPAQEAASESYVMQSSGVTMAGGPSESESYRSAASVGLGLGGGEMESDSFKAEVGIVINGLDADGDGVSAADDLCPTQYAGCLDLDFDGCIDVPDVDADADGVSAGSCDCDEADGQIWSRPGEVTSLILGQGGKSGLSWAPPSLPGGTLPRYDTIRSSSPADFSEGVADCVAADATDPTAVDAATPEPGAAFYYLIRAENACASGVGPLGISQGVYARTARACPP